MTFTAFPPLIPGAGPRPVGSTDDVMARLPEALLLPENDVIRDALVDALTALLAEWQYRSDYAAALADPMRSIDRYLTALAADHSASRSIGEDDEGLRARAFTKQACVTETAIAAGVNLILSLVTTTECQLNDGVLDRWFLNDGTDGNGGPAVWHSFLGAGPNYPDRLFADDALNNDGYSRPNSAVGGARMYGDTVGRLLFLRLPDFGFQQADAPFMSDGSSSANAAAGIGFFLGDGSSPDVAAYLNSTITDPDAIYRAICNFMDAACGQSVRWEMQSDLVAA